MTYQDAYNKILGEIRTALDNSDAEAAEQLATAIIEARQVFVVGVGRVLLSLQAFVKRLNHLGIAAYYVGEINEPAITADDLLIVGSGSGETIIPVQIARKAKTIGAKIAHIGSNPNGSVAQYVDLFVRIPVKTKLNLPDEISSEQIMSSLFEQTLYILCDSVCLLIADKGKLDLKSLWRHHANLE